MNAWKGMGCLFVILAYMTALDGILQCVTDPGGRYIALVAWLICAAVPFFVVGIEQEKK